MSHLSRRLFSTSTRSFNRRRRSPPSSASLAKASSLLSTPTWSISSLLPPTTLSQNTITPSKLHHILRLSALPPPSTPAEEASLLYDLHSQLHFVNSILSVDTSNYTPLVAIRDETSVQAVTLDDIIAAEKEVDGVGDMGGDEWDVLGNAKGGMKLGRYFVVEGEMGEGSGGENDDVVVGSTGKTVKSDRIGGGGDEVVVKAKEVKELEDLRFTE